MGEQDPSDDEDDTALVDVDGVLTCYAAVASPVNVTAPTVDALAVKRRAAKVRHLTTPTGVVQLDVPRNYREAMLHRRAPQLWAAMIREMGAQWECKSHQLVPRTDDMVVLPLGWVYDFKLKDDDVLDKARLIGLGNHAAPELHYFEKTAQVARSSSVRIVCAYAAQYDLTLTAGDVPTAFLQSFLHNVIIYSEQVPGFEQPGPNGE